METLSLNIKELLLHAYEQKASDLHLTVGVPPVYRVNGRLEHYGTEIVTPEMIDTMIREYGYEDENTIAFAKLCGTLPNTKENDLLLMRKLEEFREGSVWED